MLPTGRQRAWWSNWRQPKADLRDIDDDAVGISKCKNVQIDLAGEIHHEPRLRLVTSESDIRNQRK